MTDHLVAVLALNDTITSLKARGLILISMVVAMFLIAGLVMLIGKKRQQRQNARALADLTGSAAGIGFGDDEPAASADWYASAIAEGVQYEAPQNWRDVILGEGDGMALPAPAAPVSATEALRYAQARPVTPVAAVEPVAPVTAAPMRTEPVAPVVAPTEGYQGRRRASDDDDEPTYDAAAYGMASPEPETAQPAATGPYTPLADDPVRLAAARDIYDHTDTAAELDAALTAGTATYYPPPGQDAAYGQPAATGYTDPADGVIEWADAKPEETDSGDTSEWWQQAIAEDEAAERNGRY